MNIPAGKNPPEELYVFIEIPQGSLVKYELDKDMDTMIVDRMAFTSMGYPANYGFIPTTLADDGDPLDALVLSSYAVSPGTVIPAVPVGMLVMEDEAGKDEKILAVPPPRVDPFFGSWKRLADIPTAYLDRIRHFFEHYKELEAGKWVKVQNFLPKEDALAMIRTSLRT